VVEACCAVPLADAVVAADLDGGGGWVQGIEFLERGVDGLDAAVEGRGVELVYWRVKGDKVVS
jgi:hypothetical protein